MKVVRIKGPLEKEVTLLLWEKNIFEFKLSDCVAGLGKFNIDGNCTRSFTQKVKRGPIGQGRCTIHAGSERKIT